MLKTRKIEIRLLNIVLPFLVADDLESLVDDPADPDQTPCWAEVWPAAHGLAQYLWQGGSLNGKTVLELGAGAGLPGLVAALKGACVTFSDFQPPALELCARNARLHRLKNCKFELQDWRCFNLAGQFDLVLGSDIAYEPRLLPALRRVLLKVVKPAGKLILSHALRPVTEQFIKELVFAGPYHERQFELPVTVEDPIRPHHRIKLHVLTKTANPA